MTHPTLGEALSAQAPPGFRLAQSGDAPALDALNQRIVSSLPEGTFMRQSAAFFERVLEADGAVLMALSPIGPIAYGVAAPVGPAMPAFAPVDQPAGLLFGTAVEPTGRGMRLQPRLIALRCAALAASGAQEIQCTVAPANHISLINLIEAGFEASVLRPMLDGGYRFILSRATCAAQRGGDAGPLFGEPLPPIGPLDAHLRRIDRGERGVRAVLKPTPTLYYRRDEP